MVPAWGMAAESGRSGMAAESDMAQGWDMAAGSDMVQVQAVRDKWDIPQAAPHFPVIPLALLVPEPGTLRLPQRGNNEIQSRWPH
jgi:hypothetical protein